MSEDLLTRVQAEADLCRNDGADDIARLLDEVAARLATAPRWTERDAAPIQASAPGAASQEVQNAAWRKWADAGTVASLIGYLATLDQATPIVTAYHVTMGNGERRCKTRSLTISRERVDHATATIRSSDTSLPYTHVLWAQPPEEIEAPAVTHAARDVLAERQRQISFEGWTPEHDDEHADGSLALAAGCYALHHDDPGLKGAPAWWPWHAGWWKPAEPRRNLVKAGALILAEIERLDRAAVIMRDARLPPSGLLPSTQGGGEIDKAWGDEVAEEKHAPTATGEGGRQAVTFHTASGGVKDFLEDPKGDRRFWAVEMESSGLAAEGSQDAGATTQPLREGEADSSGLTAEVNEAAATIATAGEQLGDAMVPEPADWQFERMVQPTGGRPC